MKKRTQRVLFLAIIATGVVLPWVPMLVSAIALDEGFGSIFGPMIAALPVWPLTIPLLAAWWSLSFVVFAFLWRRLLMASWRPLRRDPLLVLLGIAIALFPWVTWGPTGTFFVPAFLAYGVASTPSWGLRTSIGKAVFALFGFASLVLFTLLGFVLLPAAGVSGIDLLQQYLSAPLGILGYMTFGLLVGYLFAKPIDLLITRGEPAPTRAEPAQPSASIVAGNMLSFSLGLFGTVLLYSWFAGSEASRYEITEVLAEGWAFLAVSGVILGASIGVAVFLLALAMLRRGSYRQGKPLPDIALAVLPGLLLGLAPGLLGERAVIGILATDYLGVHLGYMSGEIDKVAVSPDGTRIAADAAGTLLIWDIADGEPLVDSRYEPSSRWVATSGLSWGPDSQRVAVAPPTGGLAVLDSRTGRRLQPLRLPDARRPGANSVSGTAFGPDSTWLVAARTDGSIYRYELRGGQLEQAWASPVPARNMTAIAVSPDGDRLAVTGISASEGNPMGGFVAVLDAATGDTHFILDDFEQVANQLAFSADGSLLLIAGTDNPPRVVDAAAGRPLMELRNHCPPPPADSYRSLLYYTAFLGHSGDIAAACSRGTVEICDADSGACRVIFELNLLTVDGLAAHPDGRHIAVLANGSTISLWDTQTAELRQTYRLP